jgi:hypothetical protein
LFKILSGFHRSSITPSDLQKYVEPATLTIKGKLALNQIQIERARQALSLVFGE